MSCPFVCRLAIDSLDLAGRLCSAVFKGDVVLLQRLLKAGAPPKTADYDGRTALHVAAAEGHMGAVCPDSDRLHIGAAAAPMAPLGGSIPQLSLWHML